MNFMNFSHFNHFRQSDLKSRQNPNGSRRFLTIKMGIFHALLMGPKGRHLEEKRVTVKTIGPISRKVTVLTNTGFTGFD